MGGRPSPEEVWPVAADRFADVQRVFQPGRVIAGNLRRGADLLEFLTETARRHQVRAGAYNFFGAVTEARVAFYDVSRKVYEEIVRAENLEIVSGMGNVSLRDGEIFVHAHAAFSDRQGNMFGGHLNPGTVVLAGEFVLWELVGEPFQRDLDPVTGLRLWHISS
ncbi:MAG: DNA-binding protein [Bacillota bacterium]|nr:DNA-binding protein [Bacillota bacterium]REJ34351.1 MAG: DNA-binding protein [Bacillota bacterium]